MNEKGEVTTNTNEIRRIIRTFYQQLYANKLSNLEEIEAFLETYKLPRLKQEEIDFFKKDFIYLFDRERQPARDGTQAGGVGEEEAGSQ